MRAARCASGGGAGPASEKAPAYTRVLCVAAAAGSRLQASGRRQKREREREPNKRQQQAAAACTVVSGRHRHARLMYSSESACDLLPVQCREIPECAAAACTRAKSLKPRRQARSKAAPCRAFRRGGRPAVAAAVGVAHSPPWSRGQDMDRPRSGRTGQAAAQSTPLRLRAVITALLGSS